MTVPKFNVIVSNVEYENGEEDFEGTEDFSIQPMSSYSWNLVSDKHKIYKEMSRRSRTFLDEEDGKEYFMAFF